MIRPTPDGRQGAALIAVLLALALLLSLGVPFLFASRLRAESANRVYDRARARVAAESASEAAAFHQALSHPSLDPTPLWDSPEEWDLSTLGPMPQALGGEWLRAPESWGAEVESMQARVSLATAPPLLLQNLIHPSFLTKNIRHADDTIPVTSTVGFPDSGFLLMGAEWVRYGKKSDRAFLDVQPDPDPPEDLQRVRFLEGLAPIDPRVFEAGLGRLTPQGWRRPGAMGKVLDLDLGSGGLAQSDRRILETRTWMSTGDFGSADWQPASYLVFDIDPEFPESIVVGDGSMFNAGSFIRLVPEDRPPIEALVIAAGGRSLLLSQPMPIDLDPFHTQVHCLRREPVDINACSPAILEALVSGLSFTGGPPAVWDILVSRGTGPEWLEPKEARVFVRQVLNARPLKGPDDLWERVLQPLVTSDEISDFDAWAILLNSLDPTSGRLRQSTTGFAYRSGDRYLTRNNAAVRSRLGRTLSRASYREDIKVAPTGPLLDIIHDQNRLDDAMRHGRGLHGVISEPNNLGATTTAFGQVIGALTMRAGLMQQIGRVVPSIEADLSALTPVPVRSSDTFPNNAIGSVEHFDYEVSALGRKIYERGPLTRDLPQWGVPTQNGASNIEPLYIEGWFYFEGGVADGALFDISGAELRRNRLEAAVENGELLVRCWDTAGEDPADRYGLEEAITVRFDPAETPLQDRWVHVAVLLRGASARGVQVYLDGIPGGDIDGFTYLASALGGYAPGDVGGQVLVESTEGFPQRGAIRVGNEVIEYSDKTETAFILTRTQSPDGWLGGRAVRESSDPLALTLDSVHPTGSGVYQYGYSAILADDIMPGGGALTGTFGPWSMAQVVDGTEDIEIMTQLGFTFPVGSGISGTYLGPISLTAIPQAAEDDLYAEAFQSDGGFALLWTGRLAATNSQDGSRIGGIEVVRYSGRSDTTLTLSQRNVQTPGVTDWPQGAYAPEGVTYVTEWNPDILIGQQGTPIVELEAYKVYIMPISVKGSGVSDLAYRGGQEGQSHFVQITAEDDSLTEWVRYDSIYESSFLRDDWTALSRAFDQLFDPFNEDDPIENPQGQGPGGRPIISSSDSLPPSRAAPSQDPQDPELDYEFRPTIGIPEDRVQYIEEIAKRFDFRGAMGTFDHTQLAATPLVPVFMTVRGIDPSSGAPGRLDRVAAMQPGDTSPPFWFTVQWADARLNTAGVRGDVRYVAFDTHPGLPFPASDFEALQQSGDDTDLRNFARITKFPNNERPQFLQTVTVGGDISNARPPLQGIVDEFSVRTGAGMGSSSQFWSRGAFYLMEDLEEGAGDGQVIEVNERDLLVDGYRLLVSGGAGVYLSQIPDSGIVDIDGERIAYSEVRASGATPGLVIAPGGRGLHGTEIRAHASGTKVWLVDGRAATSLTQAMGAGDWDLFLEDGRGFAPSDLLLIDEEVLHAPMRARTANYFAMQRERPDDYRGQPGAGILRGRFGTTLAAHPQDSIVYAFPNRFMHTYVPESDSGMVARAQFGWDEPGAYWRSVRWEAEHLDGTARVRVLARVADAPWDGDPARTPGLLMLERGTSGGSDPVPLRLRGDRLQLRFFFDWQAGSFDPVNFDQYGWASAPRIRNLMVDYVAETVTLRREEIVE